MTQGGYKTSVRQPEVWTDLMPVWLWQLSGRKGWDKCRLGKRKRGKRSTVNVLCTTPKTDRKTNCELWFSIVPHFSLAFCFIHSTKKMAQGKINWHFPFLQFTSDFSYRHCFSFLITFSALSLALSFSQKLPDLQAPSSCPYVRDVSRWWCADHNTEHILSGVWGGGWWWWFGWD